MKKAICIHLVGWALAITYAVLIRIGAPNVTTQEVLIYLGSIYLLEAILFYVGYGFSYQFLHSKKRYLYLVSVFVIYLLIYHVLPIITRGNIFITTQDAITSVGSNIIKHAFWLAGGIAARSFLDTIISSSKQKG